MTREELEAIKARKKLIDDEFRARLNEAWADRYGRINYVDDMRSLITALEDAWAEIDMLRRIQEMHKNQILMDHAIIKTLRTP